MGNTLRPWGPPGGWSLETKIQQEASDDLEVEHAFPSLLSGGNGWSRNHSFSWGFRGWICYSSWLAWTETGVLKADSTSLRRKDDMIPASAGSRKEQLRGRPQLGQESTQQVLNELAD